MSFDVTIRSDDKYRQKADLLKIKSFIGSLPNIKPAGTNQFMFGDSENEICAFINLRLVNEFGEESVWLREYDKSIKPQTPEELKKINSISINISYVFNVKETDDALYNHYLFISEHLGWRIFDHQKDKYFDEMYNE